MPPTRFRTFNGEPYQYFGTRYRKSSAQYYCNMLRGQGFKCRIIYGGRTRKRRIRYLIYARKGRRYYRR